DWVRARPGLEFLYFVRFGDKPKILLSCVSEPYAVVLAVLFCFINHFIYTQTSCSYIAICRSTHLSHENSAARFRPLVSNSFLLSPPLAASKIQSVQAHSSLGSRRIPASPTTSGRLVALEASTNVPQAIASSAGIPNPSYREG